MKTKLTLTCMALATVLPLSSSALLITRNYSNTTSDNDNSSLEDASSGVASLGASSITLDSVGSTSSALGYRFYGQAAAGDGGDIRQNINASVTWIVSAESWEEYSIRMTPEFHAWMFIEDGGLFQENGDIVSFSTLSATLKVNGSTVSDSLNMSGGSKEDRGNGVTLDRTDSQILSGYTGNNTFELIYTATVTATSKAGSAGNDTYVAGLWGQDGTLGSIGSSDGSFDNYSSSSARNADGLFMDATVTLDAIPEPATLGLIGLFGAGLFAARRHFRL